MKRHKVLSLGLLLLAATSASAQRYMRVWQNGESDRIALSDINYSQGGSVITIGDKTYTIAEVDSITMVRTITVQIKDNQATVNLNNAPGVTYTAEGGHVVINNTNDKEEMEFVLSGTSNDASITYNGVYKCKFHLDGLNLTSTKGAALDIQCGKRIDLFLVDGTTNSLTDCAGGLQKAAFYCKGHMEVEGGGSLTVAGYTRHAIGTNEYLILKENTGNITVTNAASDAIHAGQYFWMDGGTLDLTGMAGDGIQAGAKGEHLPAGPGKLIAKVPDSSHDVGGCADVRHGGHLVRVDRLQQRLELRLLQRVGDKSSAGAGSRQDVVRIQRADVQGLRLRADCLVGNRQPRIRQVLIVAGRRIFDICAAR
jgi:hypothetical protein